MEVKINQVVLHLLDPGASEPVLSDRAMDMDADLYEYYTATLERAFASDEVKNCRFLPDSAFAAEMAQNQDFIDLSRRIAGVIFEQMLQYQAIPAGDLAVVDFTADGVPFYGVLKLNYRPGYTHHTELMGNGRFSSMVPQRTLLPGTPKADEAALIDRANGTVRLIEKKFTLDSKAPAGGYQDFLMNEARYSRLTREFPERATVLFAKNEENAKERYEHLLKLVDMYDK